MNPMNYRGLQKPAPPPALRLAGALIAAAILWLSTPAGAESTRGFVSGSLAEIEKTHAGHPFVLILWSLDCPPCLKELDFLAAELKSHPAMELVMVATDDPSAQASVESLLAEHRLAGRVDSWIFAEANAQKLRYEIDPNWYGELPRSYFYDAEHHRVPLSGVVTQRHLDAWRAANRTIPGRSP